MLFNTQDVQSRGTLQGGIRIKGSSSLFTPAQITTWLSTIGFPSHFTEDDILEGRFPTTLENLHLVARLYLVAFPYENTMMHYSIDHWMDISAEGLYQRMVVERRGSYCFGLNTLFFQMICGLGYRAYTGSARVNIAKDISDPPVYTAPSHMIIFVQLGEESNETYFVDVGCGGSGLTRPILLSDAEDNIVIGTTPTEKHRLTRGSHPASRLSSSKSEWHLEILHIKEDIRPPLWKVVYSFSEEEFFLTDYEAANFVVCRQSGGLFWENVICSKHFWLDSREIDNPILTRHMGRLGMEGRVTRRHIGPQSEIIRTVTTEAERADVLRELFGINLSTEDLEHINGREAALVFH
ncbi:arylamine N-acetyltransferase 1 [Lyophyllum atratum]|nr:arylamine N-acetyltransferase 1 [Lyophyllum atratum]